MDISTLGLILMAVLLIDIFSIDIECGKKPLIWSPKKYLNFEKILLSSGEPIDFSETYANLRKARFEIKQAGSKRSGGLFFQLESIDELLGVDERSLSHCLTVFSEIRELSRRYRESTASLIPYLEECRRQQEEFCALLNQEKYLRSRPQFEEAVNLIFGSTPVELEVNMQRLAEIKSQLSDAKSHFGSRLLPKFEDLEEEIKSIEAAQETSKYGCNFIFKDIARLSARYQDKQNLLKYFADCKILQEKFCQAQD